MCFHKGPLVLRYALVMWTLYFSHFFTSFFVGLRRIFLRAKVRNLAFINCSLLVGIDCVTDKLKATFSSVKNTFFSQNAENRFLGLWNFKIFWARTSSDPLPSLEKGDQRPLVDTVGYSIQTCWLLQFLLKPLVNSIIKNIGDTISNVIIYTD